MVGECQKKFPQAEQLICYDIFKLCIAYIYISSFSFKENVQAFTKSVTTTGEYFNSWWSKILNSSAIGTRAAVNRNSYSTLYGSAYEF